jgi:ELWxxDGT repeat protein
MKYLLRSWVHRLFSARSARTIRRSPALQVEALEDRTTPSVFGTRLIKDINTSAASDPGYLTEIDGIVYFAATDTNNDRELWRTDGTASGTYRLRDINPGSSSSNPSDLISLNGELYFSASRSDIGRELWRYNPATATLTAVDIWLGPDSSDPSDFATLNGYLYFAADDGTGIGRELWQYDPSAGTASLVADINNILPGLSSTPTDLVALDGFLYFAADDGPFYGRELWRSDGTSSGTYPVADIYSTTLSSYPTDLVALNGILYFVADNGSTGRELWQFNPSTRSADPVANLNSSGDSDPSFLTPLNGKLYFSATDSDSDRELYRYDPASNNDPQKIDINSGGSSDPQFLTTLNNKVYFTADGGDGAGRELWSYDPVTGQSVRVLDINPGASGSDPQFLTAANGQLFFSADDGSGVGRELWRTGTAITLNIIGGNHQSTQVTTSFSSLVVEVLDQWGETLPAVPVTFTAPTSGASAKFGGNSTTTVTTTDANGQAAVNATANTIAGTYTVTASVDSLTASFTLTNTPGAASQFVVLGGGGQSTQVGTAFSNSLVIQVLDAFGNPVPGATVTFAAPTTGASATLSSSTVTTNNNGQAAVNATANTIAGSYTVTASVGSLTTSFTLTNTPGALSQLAFSIQPPTAVSVGQPFRVQVQLRDQYGNAVRLPNVAIRLSLRAGSGLSGTLVKRTSANGLATFGDLVLSAPGRYRLVARLGNGLQVISRVIVVV